MDVTHTHMHVTHMHVTQTHTHVTQTHTHLVCIAFITVDLQSLKAEVFCLCEINERSRLPSCISLKKNCFSFSHILHIFLYSSHITGIHTHTHTHTHTHYTQTHTHNNTQRENRRQGDGGKEKERKRRMEGGREREAGEVNRTLRMKNGEQQSERTQENNRKHHSPVWSGFLPTMQLTLDQY